MDLLLKVVTSEGAVENGGVLQVHVVSLRKYGSFLTSNTFAVATRVTADKVSSRKIKSK